uniref:Reverse transcriptase domain-containing protein n=1 Tax=Amphimedon queenslandica TaxID=400682 RepID=A0A1X7UND5_AMPQE
MIVDLSFPKGRSVNDNIPSDLCSLSYPSLDDAVSFILELGQFTQMVKLDLKCVYLILPIHRCDYQDLGVVGRAKCLLTSVSRLAFLQPKIFTAVADALAWVLHLAGIAHLIHYLHNFLLIVSLLSDQGSQALHTALEMLADLGVPVSQPKLKGPSTTVTLMGNFLDSARLELRLPQNKV